MTRPTPADLAPLLPPPADLTALTDWAPISTAPLDRKIRVRGGRTVTPSHWIAKEERWCMFTKAVPPIEWCELTDAPPRDTHKNPYTETQDMTTFPIDVSALADEALASFPGALRDDPTAWPEGDATMLSEVERTVCETVRDTYQSLLARRIGVHVQAIATDMEGALNDDGPLADLGAVWAGYVIGLDLEDFDPVLKAKDWTARVEALGEIVAQAIHGAQPPVPTPLALDAYIATEPRLAALAVSQKHGLAQRVTDGPQLETAQPSGGFSWDEEDDEPATIPPPNVPSHSFFDLLDAAGVTLSDVAEITGIGKPTLSNAKNGKRPWPGLTETQADALADNLGARSRIAAMLEEKLRARDGAFIRPGKN
jgi:hypothetical protein